MKTITFINQKGGVAKTTSALAVGAGLRRRGFRVLFVDLDSQQNLSYALGVSNAPVTILEVLLGQLAPSSAILPQDLLAGSPGLSAADVLLSQVGKEFRLRESLQSLSDAYDFCIIDVPPSLGVLTVNALTCADYCIIPAQADAFSLAGIGQLASTIDAVRRYTNPGLRLLGILLTRFNGRTNLSRELLNMMSDVASQLHTALFEARIRECNVLREAQALQQSDIFEYAPKSNAAADYGNLIEKFNQTDGTTDEYHSYEYQFSDAVKTGYTSEL